MKLGEQKSERFRLQLLWHILHVLFVTQHLIILKTLLLGLISPLRFIV